LLSQLVNVELTIAIGRYAIYWHLDQKKDPKRDPKKSRQTKTKMTLQTIVGQWQDYLPSMVPLPHPSPRNTTWLRKNPWVEAEIIPALRTRVAQILAG
jgi:uracil-DNA glycosylase